MSHVWSVGELPAAIWPVTTSVPGVGSATFSDVVFVDATVVTWFSTVYEAVMGLQLTVAGPPTAPGDTRISIRFSLTQIGDTRPSGKECGVKSRSSMITFPCTWVIPAARTLAAS